MTFTREGKGPSRTFYFLILRSDVNEDPRLGRSATSREFFSAKALTIRDSPRPKKTPDRFRSRQSLSKTLRVTQRPHQNSLTLS